MSEHKTTGTNGPQSARLPERGRRYAPRRPERVVSHSRPVRPATGSAGRVLADISRPAAATLPSSVVSAAATSLPRMHDVVAKPVAVSPAHRAVGQARPALPRQHKSLVLKRQIKQNAVEHKRQSRELRKVQFKAFAMGGAAVVVMMMGVGIAHSFSHSHADGGQAAVSAALGASTSAPTDGNASEAPVTTADINNYKVQGDRPQQLLIPKIGVQARIFPTTLGINGEPIPVANIHDVGWLQTSARPGTSGVMLIDGSSAGPTKPGIFAGLANLTVGDTIQVSRGDGKTVVYKVASAKTYPADKVDMKAAQQPIIAGQNGLNILTDTGRFNTRTNQFENRTLIFAVQQ